MNTLNRVFWLMGVVRAARSFESAEMFKIFLLNRHYSLIKKLAD